MRIQTKLTHPKLRKSKLTSVRLTPRMSVQIRKEAKALGLSAEEYIRLIVNLAKHLRGGLTVDGAFQAKEMLALVENPLFGVLLSTVTQSMLQEKEKESKSDAVSPPTPSGSDANPVRRPQPNMQQPWQTQPPGTQQPQPPGTQQPQPPGMQQPQRPGPYPYQPYGVQPPGTWGMW